MEGKGTGENTSCFICPLYMPVNQKPQARGWIVVVVVVRLKAKKEQCEKGDDVKGDDGEAGDVMVVIVER